MSADRKRPVTYGKSPSHRLEPILRGLGDNSTRSSTSRTSPSDGFTASSPPESSIRSSQHSPRSKNSSEWLTPLSELIHSRAKLASSSPSKRENERSVMQRKRRKLTNEETCRDRTQSQINSQASADISLCGNEDILLEISHRDDNQSSSSYWRSAGRQKHKSQPIGREDEGDNALSVSQKDDPTCTRKRLVDSLGTTGKDGAVIIPISDAVPKSAHFSQVNVVSEAESVSTRPGSTRESVKLGTRDPGRLQENLTVPKPPISRSSRVTYSRQRSFLNDPLSLTDSESHGIGSSYYFDTEKELRSAHVSRIPPEDDTHDTKPVRSIHELRQAGDNARFREVVDSLFEDIEDAHITSSGRCRGLAELCAKLLDSDFVYRFSEQGFDERLVNCTPNDLDIVSASLVLSAYKLIIIGGHASRIFSEAVWAKILELLPQLLDMDDDLNALAREPSIELSRTAQASVRGIRCHLLPVIGAPSPYLSPQLLAVDCTESSLKFLRQSSHTICPIPASLLNRLVDLMIAKASANMNGHTPANETHFLLALFSILENYSVISGPFDREHCLCFQRLSQLHGLLFLDHYDRSRQVPMSYIRVILNLTNREPTLCVSFASRELVSGLARIVAEKFCNVSNRALVREGDALNEVILALGTLINLSEKTEQSRAIIVHADGSAVPIFHQLLEQFSSSVNAMDQAHSVPEVHKNVVAGYLSILLLTVCHDRQARFSVKDSLDGGVLALILSTAEKFLQYHREVEKGTRLFETWEEGESKLTERIEQIIRQVRLLERPAHQM
ncbi:wings apart-like protein regulation of heterochromatin-domain-containing protein [Aspergillus nidulans var. acristatus]